MLKVNSLHLRYGDIIALSDVSLDVKAGEVVAVVGANGAGKSSLIRAMAGIEKPFAGTVEFNGHDITGLDSYVTVAKGLGQIAEGRQIFPSLSVRDNLEVGAASPEARRNWQATLREVFHLFPRLEERQTQAAGTLSGGEQQMLAIGRCLMGGPRLMMLDEPSLGLSPAMVDTMFDIIGALHKKGMTILLVEQNVVRSLRIAERGYVLENGRITLSGSGETLLRNPEIQRAYLGM